MVIADRAISSYRSIEHRHGRRAGGATVYDASQSTTVSVEAVPDHGNACQQRPVRSDPISAIDLNIDRNRVCIATGIEIHYNILMLKSSDIPCEFSPSCQAL